MLAPISVDHVPPLQFFAQDLRKKHNLSRLLTLQAHQSCNAAYARDEQYFLHSVGMFGARTYSGNPILKKIAGDFGAGKHTRLVRKVLAEFDPKPSGIILPKGKIAKRADGERLRRVAWKIVRGLLFHHFGEVYPEDWTVGVTVTAPGEQPPEHFAVFNHLASGDDLGPYPGIFAYRFVKEEAGQYWALLLWDAVIVTVIFPSKDASSIDDSVSS